MSLFPAWPDLPSMFSPIAFSIVFFSVRWYSLMYLLALLTIYLLLRWRIKNDPQDVLPENNSPKSLQTIENILLWSFFGLLLGARLGYFLFYDLNTLLTNPVALVSPFENGHYVGFYGLSYHGGLIGALLAAWIFCQKKKLSFSKIVNFIIPAVPLGYLWGRIGNFLNSETYGKITDSSLGMHFPTDPTAQLRHPVQLYEAFGEGILIFLILWPLRNKKSWQKKFFPFYLVLYGLIRFILEFFRQPEQLATFFHLTLTVGQVLCLGMVLVGSSWIMKKT